MMEVSGLRLASLQTQTNQFGGNHKEKEQGHKLASPVKKAKIEDSSKPMENIDKIKIVPTDGRPILLPEKGDIFTDLIQNLGSS